MKRPDWVTKESLWKKHCRRVVARTRELLDDRVDSFCCAQEIVKLEFWLRAENDPDFQLFRQIMVEGDALLAAGSDVDLSAFNDSWRDKALAAAKSLNKRYLEDTES